MNGRETTAEDRHGLDTTGKEKKRKVQEIVGREY